MQTRIFIDRKNKEATIIKISGLNNLTSNEEIINLNSKFYNLNEAIERVTNIWNKGAEILEI